MTYFGLYLFIIILIFLSFIGLNLGSLSVILQTVSVLQPLQYTHSLKNVPYENIS
jgi:hypothetical protein